MQDREECPLMGIVWGVVLGALLWVVVVMAVVAA